MSHCWQLIWFLIGKHKLLQNLKLLGVLACQVNWGIAISSRGLLSSLLLIVLDRIRVPLLSEERPILCLFSEGRWVMSLVFEMVYERIIWVVQRLDNSFYLFNFARE